MFGSWFLHCSVEHQSPFALLCACSLRVLPGVWQVLRGSDSYVYIYLSISLYLSLSLCLFHIYIYIYVKLKTNWSQTKIELVWKSCESFVKVIPVIKVSLVLFAWKSSKVDDSSLAWDSSRKWLWHQSHFLNDLHAEDLKMISAPTYFRWFSHQGHTIWMSFMMNLLNFDEFSMELTPHPPVSAGPMSLSRPPLFNRMTCCVVGLTSSQSHTKVTWMSCCSILYSIGYLVYAVAQGWCWAHRCCQYCAQCFGSAGEEAEFWVTGFIFWEPSNSSFWFSWWQWARWGWGRVGQLLLYQCLLLPLLPLELPLELPKPQPFCCTSACCCLWSCLCCLWRSLCCLCFLCSCLCCLCFLWSSTLGILFVVHELVLLRWNPFSVDINVIHSALNYDFAIWFPELWGAGDLKLVNLLARSSVSGRSRILYPGSKILDPRSKLFDPGS